MAIDYNIETQFKSFDTRLCCTGRMNPLQWRRCKRWDLLSAGRRGSTKVRSTSGAFLLPGLQMQCLALK